jgi:hypothetical protein
LIKTMVKEVGRTALQMWYGWEVNCITHIIFIATDVHVKYVKI